MNTIAISHLQKVFNRKKKALNNINLHIHNGMFGILGRNGSGKSTLMNILATLIPATKGKVTINNISIKETKAIRRMIGYLPQDFDFYPNMKVEESLYYLGILSNIPKCQLKNRINEVLGQVNLIKYKRQKVKNLSGGMRKRLGIAQAIIHNPSIIIVDEPTAGLDPEERVRLRNLFSHLAKDRIVIISTHIVSDIASTCEQIAILEQGSLAYTGSITALRQQSNHKVFELMIEPSQLVEMKKQNLIITKICEVESRLLIRFVSDETFEAANEVRPDLEDAYMYFIKNI
ncbi:ABC transporter ATP-binding protein [Staphylococcus pettenkoferi]|uniref:ABC transporter ATP-binding protein n=1 Tax=Staphylococcus pettenkoferi TaxID=170573 RepID=UPI002273FB77|nr:ABC transporter ATP-binding protein [Staphylococcus pettenkoferi]MCY1575964.1 ABC transporter ATP-binding protein [Staphylococcus pettenkoferi]MCY1617770.1 ABC transporter ATP-binding protein [Staphylococcus pettenkoferi]